MLEAEGDPQAQLQHKEPSAEQGHRTAFLGLCSASPPSFPEAVPALPEGVAVQAACSKNLLSSTVERFQAKAERGVAKL